MKSWAVLADMRRGQAVILLAVIAAVMLMAVYSYRAIDRELTDLALSRRASVAYLAATVLTEKFDRLVDIGVSLATRVRFRELVEAGNWTGAIQILSSVPVDFPFVDRITLNDLQGTLMADVPPAPDVRGRNFAHRDWYQEVMRTGQPYISQVYKRVAPPAINVFVASVPIKNAKGDMLGLLILQVRSDRFFDWTAGIEAGPGGEVYVVDRRGMRAADPKYSQRDTLIDYSGVPAVQRLLQGRKGVEIASTSIGKEEQVVAYESIPRHGWGLVLEQPAKLVFATRDEQLRRVLVAYGLILMFVVCVAYMASRIVLQHRRAEENSRVNAELLQTTRNLEREAVERRRAQEDLASHTERLNILHSIDRAIIAADAPAAIAEAALQRLRNLIGVPRAIVNMFDLATGEAEWLAAVGRRRVHLGPGVRFSMKLMGDVESMRRGELQTINTAALPPGPEVEALLASGVEEYMVVPMIADGELIGGLSFGGARGEFPAEHIAIAREVATQLAIAIAHARLYERVRRQAQELEQRVAERTAQLELTASELEDLYNNSPCGYHSVDEEGLILRINNTELSWLGYSREEVAGKMHYADLMTPESAEYFRREAFPLFKRQGWLKNIEFSYVRKDGSIMPVALNATVVRDANGRYLMSRSTIYDITDRKIAGAKIRQLNRDLESRAAQLESSNKELESFSYSVSHDLRSPLRAIDGYSQILEEDYAAKLDDEGRRLFAVIRDNSQKMAMLIDDLLTFSKLGRQAIVDTTIDMNALVAEVIREVRASGAGKSAQISVADLPAARGDRALLKQVWVNLLSNAVKFAGKSTAPVIGVKGNSEGAEIVYSVKDNGAGFDMQYYNKLFGVFQRLHSTEEFPGTGVGLAIVQRVVARHGGRVWAEGKLNGGATFFFALPLGESNV